MPRSARAGATSSRKVALLDGEELLDPLADLQELLGRGAAVEGGGADPGDHLLLQAGHPDLEELVEVLAEDGQELGPLEQRARRGPTARARTRALKSSQESSRFR